MTDIYNAYSLQRGIERAAIAKEKSEALSALSPLNVITNGNYKLLLSSNNFAMADIEKNYNDKLNEFDKVTNNNVKELGKRILTKVNEKSAQLNVHEGTNGVITETLRILPAGSNAQKIQNGTQITKSQGVILN